MRSTLDIDIIVHGNDGARKALLAEVVAYLGDSTGLVLIPIYDGERELCQRGSCWRIQKRQGLYSCIWLGAMETSRLTCIILTVSLAQPDLLGSGCARLINSIAARN